MNQTPIVSHASRIPMPIAEHRKQMLLQVWLPLGISIVVFLGLLVLAVVGAANGSPAIEKWGAISTIYVILPVLMVALVLLALIGGLIYLMTKLLKNLPTWSVKGHIFFTRVALLTYRYSNAAVRPIFAVNDGWARARALWKHFF